MKATIEVLYACDGCGLKDTKVNVPQRDNDQDVRDWFDNVLAPTISQNHHGRSPDCPSRSMKELKIRIDGAEYIGGPVMRRTQ